MTLAHISIHRKSLVFPIIDGLLKDGLPQARHPFAITKPYGMEDIDKLKALIKKTASGDPLPLVWAPELIWDCVDKIKALGDLILTDSAAVLAARATHHQ